MLQHPPAALEAVRLAPQTLKPFGPKGGQLNRQAQFDEGSGSVRHGDPPERPHVGHVPMLRVPGHAVARVVWGFKGEK